MAASSAVGGGGGGGGLRRAATALRNGHVRGLPWRRRCCLGFGTGGCRCGLGAACLEGRDACGERLDFGRQRCRGRRRRGRTAGAGEPLLDPLGDELAGPQAGLAGQRLERRELVRCEPDVHPALVGRAEGRAGRRGTALEPALALEATSRSIACPLGRSVAAALEPSAIGAVEATAFKSTPAPAGSSIVASLLCHTRPVCVVCDKCTSSRDIGCDASNRSNPWKRWMRKVRSRRSPRRPPTIHRHRIRRHRTSWRTTAGCCPCCRAR